MRKLLLTILVLSQLQAVAQIRNGGFVLATEVIPSIVLDIRYHTSDNFVGVKVDGYLQPLALVSVQAAEALSKVQEELAKEGLGLKIFDAYRPQKGVNHFIRWAKSPADTLTKRKYYPNVDKKDIFKLGYVASRSGHSRGSTLDLTIIRLETQEELDMGSGWDFFGDISGHGTAQITPEQTANRLKLKSIMEKNGFKAYSKEWWHYTLRNEPFPDTYFDFDVE